MDFLVRPVAVRRHCCRASWDVEKWTPARFGFWEESLAPEVCRYYTSIYDLFRMVQKIFALRIISRIWCSRQTGWLHAPGNRSLRGVHHQRDDDVFRLDLRYENQWHHGAFAVPSQLSGFAVAKSNGQESERWPAATCLICRGADARSGAAHSGRTDGRCGSVAASKYLESLGADYEDGSENGYHHNALHWGGQTGAYGKSVEWETILKTMFSTNSVSHL